MKIAIASSGNTLNAKIDKQLARCSYFLLFDSVSKNIEFIENPCKTLSEHAGLEAIKLFKRYNIKRIITTDVGYKIKAKLDDLKIQTIIISDNNKKMKELLKIMNTK